MRRPSLTAGAVLLSIWSGLNALLAIGILVAMTAFGRNPPSLPMVLSDQQIQRLDPNGLGLIKALAVLANACIAGFCLLILSVVWTSLVRRVGWAPWALGGAMGLVQAFGFVSDAYIGNQNLLANAISTGVLIGGMVLSRAGYARRSSAVMRGRRES
jgi:hypothetical protein